MEKDEYIKAYQQLPTGNIADAMAKLGIPCGTMVNGPKPLSIFQPRMAGFARTVIQMPRHQSKKEKKLVKHLEVINSVAEAGDVIVINVFNRQDVCTGGGMGALRAKQRGISGILVNGCYRDLRDVAEMEYPLFCNGGCPNKSVPMLETVDVDKPTVIGGVQIRPGDFIVGDDTGIVVLPPEYLDMVLPVAQRINRIETYMQEYILSGIDYGDCRKMAEAKVTKEESENHE